MKRNGSYKLYLLIFAGFLLAASLGANAQEQGKEIHTAGVGAASQQTQSAPEGGTVRVAAGQEITVEGIIVSRNGDSLILQNPRGMKYNVMLATTTDVKERKSNPFRGAKKYSSADLLRGLSVEVKGRGDNSGNLAAHEVKLRGDDLKVAQSLDAGVHPVEEQLGKAEARLSQSEQNQNRLSGQVDELQAVSNAARGGAKAAQETADSAVKAAEEAQKGVRTTNERIASLDDFNVKEAVTVNFRAGSSVLSPDAKSQLDEIARKAQLEKGYLIEVNGYASADGNAAFNQRLSQRRADSVIQYLAENYNIPIRRFITPFGYGDKQPVADNKTHQGREMNRRVEVKVLINKGLVTGETAIAEKGASTN